MGLSSLYFPLPYIVKTILSLYSILFGNSLPLFGVSPSLAMPLILFIDRGREKWWETFEYL